MKTQSLTGSPSPSAFPAWVCAALVIGVFLAYAPIWKNEFTHYDDQDYVSENQHVQQGLTGESIRWAFTSREASNWHPATWLSHMLDYELFGLNPRGHHAMNVLLHACNSILLFLLLYHITGWGGISAFAAGVFALHPVHVESAAWISERKDTLSVCFFLLTLLAYVRYTRRPNMVRYFLVFVLFAVGLMAKPMLVTLPFVLLLLDIWPLERWKPGQNSGNSEPGIYPGSLARLIVEKVPLILLTVVSCVITYRVQQSGGAMQMHETLSAGMRLANAVVAYPSYLVKFLYPADLAVIYPYPVEGIPLWKTLTAAGILTLLTLLFLLQFPKQKYLLIGWLFFLGTLVPVIGLVQIGSQAMADRYLYIPSIGILICLGGAAADWLKTHPNQRSLGIGVAAVLLCLLGGLTFRQVRFWKNDQTLFGRALAVTDNNYTAHNNYSQALLLAGKTDEALHHAEEAIRINPRLIEAIVNAGLIHEMKGNYAEAERYYQKALSLQPDRLNTLYNMVLFYATPADKAYQKPAEAIALAEKAAKLTDYQDAKFLDALALAHWSNGDSRTAFTWAQKALDQAKQRNQGFLAGLIEKHMQMFQSTQP